MEEKKAVRCFFEKSTFKIFTDFLPAVGDVICIGPMVFRVKEHMWSQSYFDQKTQSVFQEPILILERKK